MKANYCDIAAVGIAFTLKNCFITAFSQQNEWLKILATHDCLAKGLGLADLAKHLVCLFMKEFAHCNKHYTIIGHPQNN